MTVSVTTVESAAFAGNGATTNFSTGFAFDADSWVKVYLYNSDGTRTLQTLTTHYTLTGSGTGSAGTCTFLTAPATGKTVKMFKVPPLTQTQDYTNGSSFPNELTEAALDKLTHIVQYHESELERVLKVVGTSSVSSIELPDLTNNAGKALVVNDAEDGYEYVTLDSAIPDQTGNSGEFLTTDGSTLSFSAVSLSGASVTGTLPVSKGGTGSTTAADARTALGVTATNVLPSQSGNNGKYLTTDGSTSSWATVSSGTTRGQWSYISTTSISGNTPTITLPGGYNAYKIEIYGLTVASGDRPAIRVGTPSIQTGGSSYAYVYDNNTHGSSTNVFGSAATSMAIISNTAGSVLTVDGTMTIYGADSASRLTTWTVQTVGTAAAGSTAYITTASGQYDTAETHTAIQFGATSSSTPAGGAAFSNITSGTLYLYGLNIS